MPVPVTFSNVSDSFYRTTHVQRPRVARRPSVFRTRMSHKNGRRGHEAFNTEWNLWESSFITAKILTKFQ